jgi:tRNA/tmRNA/rRNA uracil-C5-methylase (TrmA/RlmC/RlmD family)
VADFGVLLERLAGLRREVVVEELSGGPLGWRTRMQFAVASGGRLGLRRHRSTEVEVLDRCPIGAPGVGDRSGAVQTVAGCRLGGDRR